MVRDGDIPETASEFDAWIAARPGVREPLVGGGYGTEFDAEDLFPLLEAMIGRAGGSVPTAGVAPARGNLWYVVGFVALLVVVAVLVVMATRSPGGGVG